MGISGLADVNGEEMQKNDERVAEEFDRNHGFRPSEMAG
jgi:hypothetical protein